MEVVDEAEVSLEAGVATDSRGKPGKRQVSVLAREAWQAACSEVGAELPWVARRANLFVAGIELASSAGRVLRIGDVRLAVSCETEPCENMEKAHAGLEEALKPDWRGGISCRVLRAGVIRTGDPVSLE